MRTNRFFPIIIFIFLFISSFVFPQDKKTTKDEIDALLKNKFFKTSQIAIDIYDLTDKKSIYKKNNTMLLHPASNMKIITTSTALYFLSPEYQFTTSIYYDGEIIDSICTGNIYIVGTGDPDFTIKDLDLIIENIKKFGIKEIQGNLYGDISNFDSLFWGQGWMWDDDPSTDFPYITPLIINDAAIEVFCSPSSVDSLVIVQVNPQTDYFKIFNNTRTTNNKNQKLNITRDWLDRSDDIYITGELDVNRESQYSKFNLSNPAKFFMYLMYERLTLNDVKLNGSIGFSITPCYANLFYTLARPYKEVIVNLNKTSDNLSAEITLRAMGLKFYGKPTSAKDGLKLVDSLITIIGLDPSDYRLVDGSGVSHYNLVTAELLTKILIFFYNNYKSLYGILYESFPIAGIDGTLKTRMKGTEAENNVHAKTGTLSGVSCLSGYLTAANDHQIAFSILIQNFVGSSTTARNIQDEICRILCKMK
ncbi:MAG: D-alanyl-D-alanine carboxypeptidase/D-alanyl-D-alanine-endopeptidase [Ignavibacteriales bacterium]|nr:D-alanyl-D-alanine carboxypeptidase/D-alanyl-D-alanine-endopeptidase [Ignavibacteriales bacterium]